MPATASPAETFTTRDGRRYEVVSISSWTTIAGQRVTQARINMDNPATGHGWGGVIDIGELKALRAEAV